MVLPTVFGIALIYLGKLWFLDRMAWLWEDMKEADQEYRKWWTTPEKLKTDKGFDTTIH